MPLTLPSTAPMSRTGTQTRTNALIDQNKQAQQVDAQKHGVEQTQQTNDLDAFLQHYGSWFDAPQSNSAAFGGGAGGSGSIHGVSEAPAVPGTWTPPPVGVPNPQSSSNVAFARAKDTVGSSMSGLLKAVKNQFSTRGLTGSNLEGRGIVDALMGGEKQLADVAREQAIQDTNTGNNFAQMGYQGGIAQRGQDIGLMEANANAGLAHRSQDITMRGQDLMDRRAGQDSVRADRGTRTASITGLMNAFRGGRY